MVRIYTSPSCSSCRKVKKWFLANDILFIEKNIFAVALKESELKDILLKTDNGFEDIIATKSKIIKEKGVDLDTMTTSEVIAFIQENPSILKRPIIVDDTKIQVGYNPDEISAFIPHARRLAEWACSKEVCEKYISCDHVKEVA